MFTPVGKHFDRIGALSALVSRSGLTNVRTSVSPGTKRTKGHIGIASMPEKHERHIVDRIIASSIDENPRMTSARIDGAIVCTGFVALAHQCRTGRHCAAKAFRTAAAPPPHRSETGTASGVSSTGA